MRSNRLALIAAVAWASLLGMLPAFFIIASADPALAYLPDTRSCLVRLDDAVRPGKAIHVLMTGDSLLQATYLGITPDRSALRVQVGGEAQSLAEFPMAQIRAVKYASAGHVQMRYALYGLLVGAAGGALVGAIAREPSSGGMDFTLHLNTEVGAILGGLGGLILAPLISIGIPHGHVVTCVEPEKTLPATYLVTFDGGESVGAREVRMRADMVFVAMTNGRSIYVNPARVQSIVDKDGRNRTREVLDEMRSLR